MLQRWLGISQLVRSLLFLLNGLDVIGGLYTCRYGQNLYTEFVLEYMACYMQQVSVFVRALMCENSSAGTSMHKGASMPLVTVSGTPIAPECTSQHGCLEWQGCFVGCSLFIGSASPCWRGMKRSGDEALRREGKGSKQAGLVEKALAAKHARPGEQAHAAKHA